jgi:hypothetical protein
VELVENPHVSDFTRRTLEQFSWVVGDPIPADLGAMLLSMKSALPASSRADVLIDATLLSAENKQQVLDMLAAAKRVKANRDKAEAVAAATAEMAPDVAALYQQLENAGPTIVDDRDTPKEPPPPVEEKPAEAPAPPAEDAMPPMVILPFCPRCGWDMRQRFDVEITDVDKQDFLAATIGGTRFERRFKLMGGKFVLVFRSMLADENRLIHRQLILDQNKKDVVTEAEWFLRMLEYRLACSLDRVEGEDGRLLHEVPTLEKMPHTPPEDSPLETALVPLLKFVNGTVLAHEVTRRLAGQHLRQFQRLVEALEAMALEPSFWNGIG